MNASKRVPVLQTASCNVPPIASTHSLAMARPSPLPSVPLAVSERTKSWKIVSRSPAGMPGPESVTASAMPFADACTSMDTPPVCVNLTALPARLSNTCRNRAPSSITVVATSGATRVVKASPFALGASVRATPSTRTRKSTGSGRSALLDRFAAASVSTSSTRSSCCRAAARIVSTWSVWAGVRSVSVSQSARPTMLAAGARRSCPTMASTRSRSWEAARTSCRAFSKAARSLRSAVISRPKLRVPGSPDTGSVDTMSPQRKTFSPVGVCTRTIRVRPSFAVVSSMAGIGTEPAKNERAVLLMNVTSPAPLRWMTTSPKASVSERWISSLSRVAHPATSMFSMRCARASNRSLNSSACSGRAFRTRRRARASSKRHTPKALAEKMAVSSRSRRGTNAATAQRVAPTIHIITAPLSRDWGEWERTANRPSRVVRGFARRPVVGGGGGGAGVASVTVIRARWAATVSK